MSVQGKLCHLRRICCSPWGMFDIARSLSGILVNGLHVVPAAEDYLYIENSYHMVSPKPRHKEVIYEECEEHKILLDFDQRISFSSYFH